MEDEVDTGFADVLDGGAVWEEPSSAPPASCPLPSGEGAPAVTPVQGGAEVVTAAVTAVPGLTEAGKQAAKMLVALPPLDYTQLAKLAREIAMDIKERHSVLQEFDLNEPQYEYLTEHNEFYKQALQAASMEWHSPLSTQERIKLEAAALLEDALPGLGARLQNTREQLPGVVEAAKLFAKIAGVGERDAGTAAPGERFVINIDLGAGKTTTISTGPPPDQIASSGFVGPAPDDAWADDHPAPVRRIG